MCVRMQYKMIPAEMKQELIEYFISFPDTNIYAVIDGASTKGLLGALNSNQPEYSCLFSGKLDTELAETAPYLIRLDTQAALMDWLLDGWGKHYGIYALVPNEMGFKAVRKHFRSFMVVKSPQNKPLHFRYYDPRTLRDFLPMCDKSQQNQMFGPIKLYIAEGVEPLSVNRYWKGAQGVEYKTSLYQEH